MRGPTPRILLINPNTNRATTEMMVAIARAEAGDRMAVEGATAASGVPMILDEAALAASAEQVVAIGAGAAGMAGIIVGAFGDPGLEMLRGSLAVPVVGLCEAGMLEASSGGRRFGVATTTPALAGAIDAKARTLGLGPLYTGIRLTPGDPAALVGDPERLEQVLADAVALAVGRDGAQAVVIGGGPLGRAASTLERRFAVPVIGPVPAAIRRMALLLEK
ncbi:aspartate/glutamate racemase family protein [Inquilinus sp. Marseille-Q2685]|uniref:aspartate/glutamate racemase family protein n=1 Tax=Inquilinus sp. Marseille-Q2685 TaxID=2866581 RepID=UPI001CE3DC16|nr:aspartate/glutamate racemase family protein [Inquilinus sp. Marseille-Q2685]